MVKIEIIVVASGNPAKVDRYKMLLANVSGQVVGLKDLGITEKPEETGSTAEKNAEIKAKFYTDRTHLPVFCEDEALHVDFLPPNQQPGVHVRRINKTDEVDDKRLLSYYQDLVAKTPAKNRKGHWHIAYCLAIPDGNFKVIANDFPVNFYYPPSKIVIPGWPLSSIQGSVLIGKPHSEMTEEDHKLINLNRDRKLEIAIRELFDS